MHQLNILFEDNHCLAVAKPAPLLTQGVPPGIATLESMVKDYLKTKFNKPGNVYLGIPHRLDRPVSGVVVFARNSKAAARLAEQFERRQVSKVYWGAVEGIVEPPEGTWCDWLRKIKEESRSEATAPGADGRARRCCNIASSLRTPGAAWSSLFLRPVACTRSACKPPCMAIRFSAIYNTAGSRHSARPPNCARSSHRSARTQPYVFAPDPLRADDSDGAAARLLGEIGCGGYRLRELTPPRSPGWM